MMEGGHERNMRGAEWRGAKAPKIVQTFSRVYAAIPQITTVRIKQPYAIFR